MSIDILALVNPGVRELKPYQPGKPIEELRRELGITDIIKLASNENPLGFSSTITPQILAAAKELNRYPDGSGYMLKQAIQQQRRIQVNQITLANGSDEIFTNVLRVFAMAEAQHEVIISQYAFAAYAIAARSLAIKVVEVAAQNWAHDLTAIAQAVNAKTRVIFLANPNNPTGTYFNNTNFYNFMRQIPSTVIVVLDQAYYEYVIDAVVDYSDGLALLAEFPNLIVTNTFSKAYGLAGIRVGYAISSPLIAELLNRVRLPFNVNSVAFAAAAAALADQVHIKRSIQVNQIGMQQYQIFFKQMGLSYIKSVGNFISVNVGVAADKVYNEMLRAGIIVRPLLPYQMPQHLRITIGLETENDRCMQALKKILAK